MIEKDLKDEQVLRLQDIGAENLARIIVGSALSIPGVNSMSPRLTETIMEGVPGINLELNGVKIEEEKNQILCDLYINVEFGAKIPEIAWDIQTKVRDTVKELTGLSLHEINIHVQGVRKKKNEEEK